MPGTNRRATSTSRPVMEIPETLQSRTVSPAGGIQMSTAPIAVILLNEDAM